METTTQLLPQAEVQALPKAQEQNIESLYDFNKFVDADGNTAFRWESANQVQGEAVNDVSLEADRTCLDSYMAERAIGYDTPEKQQSAQEAFTKNMHQLVDKKTRMGDRVELPIYFGEAEEQGIEPASQLRLGAIRAVARDMGFSVGAFVLDAKSKRVSFSAVKPTVSPRTAP
jgi:hypothetical protein